MYDEDDEETTRFPDLLRADFDEIQLREIPPTPTKTTFESDNKPRSRVLSVTESEHPVKADPLPQGSGGRGRGRSHSNTESTYSIFPDVSRRSTKTRTRANSHAASERSATLDVPVRSSTRSSASSSMTRSRGYSNASSDGSANLEVPLRKDTFTSRPRGDSNSDSVYSTRSSNSQDCGDRLLSANNPVPAVARNDLMMQFESFVDSIDEVPTRRLTLKRAKAPDLQALRWMKIKRTISNPKENKSHLDYEKANNDASHGDDNSDRWRGRCVTATIFAGTVLVVHVIFMMWAAQRAGVDANIGTVYEGSCDMVDATSTGLHILINIMVTIITMATAYALQFLSSVTREDIDEAHAMGKSLDIGVLSVRNLKSFKKRAMFGLLIISSLPFHFLSNSMVFTASPELDYDVVIAAPQFLNESSIDCSQDVATSCSKENGSSVSCTSQPLSLSLQNASNLCDTSTSLHQNATQNKLQRLDQNDCLTAYSTLSNPSSNFGNVLVITKAQPLYTNNTILNAFHHISYSSVLSGHGWTCGPDDPLPGKKTCDIDNLILNADIWTLGPSLLPTTSNFTSLQPYVRWDIDYCLVETLSFKPMCKLQYSRLVTICMIIATAIKFFSILIVATRTNTLLCTVVDAVSSFQERTDAVTSNRNFIHRNSAWKSKDGLLALEPQLEGQPRNLRWFHGASLRLWLLTLFWSALLLASSVILLTTATAPIPDPFSLSLGLYSPVAVLNIFSWSSTSFIPVSQVSTSQLFTSILLANLPQFVVSILLFLFAQVYTRMLSASTFETLISSSYLGNKLRKVLGFSFVHLYFFISAVLGMVLHFMISQAFFVHHIEVVGSYGVEEGMEYLDVGYNPLGILISLAFGSAMLILLLATGLKKLKGGIVVGSGSLEIAAACKPGS